jgi:hypothetical protein
VATARFTRSPELDGETLWGFGVLVLVMSMIFNSTLRSLGRQCRADVLGALVVAVAACLGLSVLAVPAARAQQLSSSQLGSGETGTQTGQSAGVSATLEQCLTAVDAVGRSATFSGQMVAVSGTSRMTMRIDVQERATGEAFFHTLNAPGLGVWRRSAGGVKIYKYLKQVTNLPAPAAFRAIVSFRWVNDQGHTIKRAQRHTPTCEEPDTRPKLVVTQVRASPLGGLQADYLVTVRNEGHSAAGAFGASLGINGLPQALPGVTSLAAGARTVLELQAPRCAAGSTIEVQLDPAHLVAEAVGGGLTYTAPCPLGETGAGTVGDTSGGSATSSG